MTYDVHMNIIEALVSHGYIIGSLGLYFQDINEKALIKSKKRKLPVNEFHAPSGNGLICFSDIWYPKNIFIILNL